MAISSTISSMHSSLSVSIHKYCSSWNQVPEWLVSLSCSRPIWYYSNQSCQVMVSLDCLQGWNLNLWSLWAFRCLLFTQSHRKNYLKAKVNLHVSHSIFPAPLNVIWFRNGSITFCILWVSTVFCWCALLLVACRFCNGYGCSWWWCGRWLKCD